MNKRKICLFLVIFCILAGLFAYFNRDMIATYFTNKEWEIAEIAGSVMLDNYYVITGTASNLVVVGNNYIRGFDANGKENFDESVSIKNAVTSAKGDYCIVGEKEGSKIYMINANAKIWESEIQGSIYAVSVNKNGYSAIIYKQTGYKTLIKVLSPQGEEVFTSYLASTYAVDAEISNDNKTLAIAEINTEGINAESDIKIIDINRLEQDNVKAIPLDKASLITNIEYTNKNDLLIQTNNNIQLFDGENLSAISGKFSDDTYFASIENFSEAVLIDRVENGLFDVKYKVEVLDTNGNKKEHMLERLPTMVKVQKNRIAVMAENQLLILNANAKLIKRYEVTGSVKDICLFDEGESLAIIYRDKIEFIKNI